MAQQIENIQEKLNWHWRNSMRPVRFFAFDARAAFVVPVLLVYIRVSSIIFTVATLFFFRFLEQKGLTFPAAMRSFRAAIVGKSRPGHLSVYRKRFTDMG